MCLSHSVITELPKVIRVIAKVAPTSPLRRSLYNSSAHFQREKYVFDIVLPTFEKFQETRGLKPSRMFNHYPTVIASDCTEGQEFVLQNDLAAQGFKNFQRTEPLDYDNVLQILTELAEFHAVSIAMKDQAPDIFAKIVGQLRETIFVAPLHSSFEGFLKRQVGYAMETLQHNPAKGDDAVCKRLFRFRDEYGPSMVECVENKDDVVICHGDCWISNVLYRHKVSREWLITLTFAGTLHNGPTAIFRKAKMFAQTVSFRCMVSLGKFSYILWPIF